MKKSLILGIALSIVVVSPAMAYVGPGLGLGAIAAILGVVGSIILAIIAIIWYPIKRLFRRKKNATSKPQQTKLDE